MLTTGFSIEEESEEELLDSTDINESDLFVFGSSPVRASSFFCSPQPATNNIAIVINSVTIDANFILIIVFLSVFE
jgi:hypothetical protein